MDENLGSDWPVKAMPPPILSSRQWYYTGLIGLILISMALLQLFSFADFYSMLGIEGFGAPKVWAAAIVAAELWGAASLFKIRLSEGFRAVSRFFAGGVALFWLVETVRIFGQTEHWLVFNDHTYRQTGVGFFGRFLLQIPGWWTVAEATVFIFSVLYALEISRLRNSNASKLKLTIKKRR